MVNKGPAHLVYSRAHIDIYQLTYPKQNPGIRQIILGAWWYLGWGDGTDYRYQSFFLIIRFQRLDFLRCFLFGTQIRFQTFERNCSRSIDGVAHQKAFQMLHSAFIQKTCAVCIAETFRHVKISVHQFMVLSRCGAPFTLWEVLFTLIHTDSRSDSLA